MVIFISLNPFGFLLLSDKQVRILKCIAMCLTKNIINNYVLKLEIWNSLVKLNSVWFFDATGSVHKDVQKQKKPYLYSIVFHDQKNKCILPIAEFISTAHDHLSISNYLMAFRTKLESNKISIAKSIVVDMSWALINSTMKSFNDCNLANYLNWCYCLLFDNVEKKWENVMKIRLFLCSPHFLKNIIKRSKKVDSESSIRKSFIFMFTLIQNQLQ